jgi:all-trans-nonaprenyl-diphosphate synthase
MLEMLVFLFIFWLDTGVAEGPTVLLNFKKESREPVSLTNLFEVVAADLQTLKQNLRSVSALSRYLLLSS